MTSLTSELRWLVERARPRRLRSMRAFAEEEIVIPGGPFCGRRFRCERQPYTKLWFDAVDSGLWSRCVATGPTQSGKTLSCFTIPLLYHLFEIGETVICGLPDMDMASDKWREDILPAIERSRYRNLLPSQGSGSRGGKVETIQFTNGATLKFMSGGGRDKSRAGFTSRVVVVTETDGLDESGTTSRESDKVTQLEARTRAYGNRKRIYLECTVSTERGRTWQEYIKSTHSRIVLLCPHCAQWVSPEREHLIGWQTADSMADARENAQFVCPSCQEPWSNAEREAANRSAKLLHENQTIDADGEISGEPPRVDTLGFRWSGVHNLFATPGDLAADEWRAIRAVDEENAEREMRQFVWCLPVASSTQDEISLEIADIIARGIGMPRGVVPATAQWLTAGIDLGKYLIHWIVVAWSEDATGQVIDYGRIETACDDLGVEQAVYQALRQFQDFAAAGWPIGSVEGTEFGHLSQAWIDAGYLPEVVNTFCRQWGQPYIPSLGRGATQTRRPGMANTRTTGSTAHPLGDGILLCWVPTERIRRIEVDSDHWKTWVHQRLRTPMDQAGALTLFRAPLNEHMSLARHLTAERKTESYVAGRGVVVQWERVRRQNHWLDALYNAAAAAHVCGARLLGCETQVEAHSRSTTTQVDTVNTSDGRPWAVVEAWRELRERYMG